MWSFTFAEVAAYDFGMVHYPSLSCMRSAREMFLT